MPWYAWLLLAVAAFVAATAVTLRLLRMTDRGRRFLALSSRGKLRFGRALLADVEVPLAAKLTLLVLVGYLAMPIDLIPDFIPVAGQLDDLAIVVIVVAILILAVPREQFETALARAEEEERSRLSGPERAPD